MKKILRLTEQDLVRLVNKVVNEEQGQMDVSSDSEHYQERKNEISIPFDDLAMLGLFADKFCRAKEGLPDCKSVKRLISRYNLFM